MKNIDIKIRANNEEQIARVLEQIAKDVRRNIKDTIGNGSDGLMIEWKITGEE